MSQIIPLSLVELEEAFLRLSAAVLAAGKEPSAMSAETIGHECRQGNVLLKDCWQEQAEWVHGKVAIYYDAPPLVPLWWMLYLGRLENQQAIRQFLEHVLQQAYERPIFYGGRGPARAWDKDLEGIRCKVEYRNLLAPGSSFAKFSGREWIMAFPKGAEPVLVQELTYTGGLAISPEWRLRG